MSLAAYCPRCGGPVTAKKLSIGVCGRCGRYVYANSRPTAGVFLVRNGQVLMVQRGVEPRRGSWDIPGGFLDEGEHPEDGARRELLEELGLKLGKLRLVATSINRLADGAVLDILFEAEAPAAEPIAGSDVMGWRWFEFDALPGDIAFASTRRAIEAWLAKRNSM